MADGPLKDMPTKELISELRVWATDVRHVVAAPLMKAAADRLEKISPEQPDATPESGE